MNSEKSMEDDAYMQLNHKDMKRWFSQNKELRERCAP